MHCTVKPGMYSIEWSFLPVAQRLRGGASAEPPQVAQTKFCGRNSAAEGHWCQAKKTTSYCGAVAAEEIQEMTEPARQRRANFFLPLLIHLRIASFSRMCLVSRPVSSLTKFPERKSL
jgi:hypothetical protein